LDNKNRSQKLIIIYYPLNLIFKAFNCVIYVQKHMEESQPISQVRNMRSGINTKGIVKSMGDPRTVNLKSGGTIDVCDAILADGEAENDQIKLTLWGDDIKAVNIGDSVVITNGYTNSFKDEVSLTKGKFGKMEINP
jgi:replication factor A1